MAQAYELPGPESQTAQAWQELIGRTVLVIGPDGSDRRAVLEGVTDEGLILAGGELLSYEQVRYCNAITDTAQMGERELAEVQALVEAFERDEFRYMD
jgi:hypothetical protein